VERKTVVALLAKSLQNIAIFDSELLSRKVREECVNHRLAFYIEALYEEVVGDDRLYCIDLEYNKNLGRSDKVVEDANGRKIRIRPDIIVHKRDSNKDNLIAIEAKHELNSPHDIWKLTRLLDEPYNYTYAAGISYYPKQNYFSLRLFWKDKHLRMESFDIEKIDNSQIKWTRLMLTLHAGE
jgi:hypothetical protein